MTKSIIDIAREIVQIAHGWNSATFGWQDGPLDDGQANYEKAKAAHDAEFERRIVVVLERLKAAHLEELAGVEMPEPVLWQVRFFESHPNTVNFGTWSEWELITPRNIHTDTVADRIRKIQSYIEQGYKYELRSLIILDQCKQAIASAVAQKQSEYDDYENLALGLTANLQRQIDALTADLEKVRLGWEQERNVSDALTAERNALQKKVEMLREALLTCHCDDNAVDADGGQSFDEDVVTLALEATK